MSAAACKTILCSGDAKAGIQSYLILARYAEQHNDKMLGFKVTPHDLVNLELAANAALWELQQVIEVTHLLAEQDFAITDSAAYPLIHEIDLIEKHFTDKTRAPGEVATFLSTSAASMREAIRKLHVNVTGLPVDY